MNCQVLDGYDKDGNEVISEDEEEYGDEDEDGEGDGDFIDEDELDEETRKRLQE